MIQCIGKLRTKVIGVYKITSPTGKIYIGSSIDIEARKNKYRRLGCKNQPKLYNSIIKYGWENHKFDVIEICSIEKLYEKEYKYGIEFNVLDKNNLNCKLPKIGDAKTYISQETLKKYSESQIGKKASKETKLKMSISGKGRKSSFETKEKQKLSNKNLKIVLNLETGIYYYGTGEASLAMNMNRNTLKNKLNGGKKNNTYLMYV